MEWSAKLDGRGMSNIEVAPRIHFDFGPRVFDIPRLMLAWHWIGCLNGMMNTLEQQELSPQAPPLLVEVRNAFDARMMDLYHLAMDKLGQEPTTESGQTVPVDFAHEAFMVTAVYDCEQEQFVQLIVRDPLERYSERPSFTISLFL